MHWLMNWVGHSRSEIYNALGFEKDTVHGKETLNNRLGPSTISIEIKLSITDHRSPEVDLRINTGWGRCRTTRLATIIECDTLWKKEMLKIKKLVADDYDIKTSYYLPKFFSVSQCGKRNNVILGKSFSSLSTWNAFLLPANNPCLQTARVQTHFCICSRSAFTMAWHLSAGKKEKLTFYLCQPFPAPLDYPGMRIPKTLQCY